MGSYMGEALKNQSDMIMNATFTRDIAYRLCYINGEPVDAKYITHTYYSISKDAVDYHLQFRPKVHYPFGTYIDIPDDTGTYRTWLILNKSDEPQFPKYNILKCNRTFRWIHNGVVHEQLGVLRTRNNYNSGLWNNYLTTTPENQKQFIVPSNDNTNTIQYNKRFLISENKEHPIAWEVSKVDDVSPIGITYITLTQDLYDPKKDNKELMIADYYTGSITPKDEIEKKENNITYSGTPSVKVGGGYKIFRAESFSEDNSWTINGLDESQYTVLTDESTIKIKVIRDYTLIGKTMTLSLCENDEPITSIEIEVVSL